MIDFDVLFLDVTSDKYYDNHVLEKQGLGGTEATCVRVAEGLAGFGLKVAVVQAKPAYFEPMTSKHAFYFHFNDMNQLRCKHFIQLRGVSHLDLFPKAKKYVWLHDTADDKIKTWNDTVFKNKATVIGVSMFHRREIKKHLLTSNVEYIYNPVPDEAYKPLDVELKYDPTRFVWSASPHKGLGKALDVFARIRKEVPTASLLVANPGYLNLDTVNLSAMPGVQVLGPLPFRNLWNILEQSLCVFYPSQFDETFGLILAEANALGVPMLGYQHGVLNEVVSSEDQLVEDGNTDLLVERGVSWTKGNRPKVEGRKEFKLSSVIFKWIQLLGRN